MSKISDAIEALRLMVPDEQEADPTMTILATEVAALHSRLAAAEAERDEAKRAGDHAFQGFQQICFTMTGTDNILSFMDALKPHNTAEAYAKGLRERCIAAEAEAATFKEIADTRTEQMREQFIAMTAAEAERNEWKDIASVFLAATEPNQPIPVQGQIMLAQVRERARATFDAHLASRPEGEVRHG